MLEQLNMFGPPEPVTSYPAGMSGRHDDAPCASERELLWPSDLVRLLGKDLLERLYGDLPFRTRLHVREVCRRLRCDSQHVYNLHAEGSLDAVDIATPAASRAEWRFYRYSVVRFLFAREFRDNATRASLPKVDLDRIAAAVAELIKARRGQ
jgi:hypothetical protein